jgi:hypothetical protein
MGSILKKTAVQVCIALQREHVESSHSRIVDKLQNLFGRSPSDIPELKNKILWRLKQVFEIEQPDIEVGSSVRFKRRFRPGSDEIASRAAKKSKWYRPASSIESPFSLNLIRNFVLRHSSDPDYWLWLRIGALNPLIGISITLALIFFYLQLR